eukprot:CAMPEP_0181418362 /NCGR_PEP_ID=MMETSP1110-20121109/11518_1 /TAXON_ID=174948 /ORGANISM="Symbiodinium sp., Strain CCMP421" /LENGTH=137 /DNA_ID=CAMNT_0023541343 /DNA_START=347 /DNA_END=760 /DNA_ORIENTATION=-
MILLNDGHCKLHPMHFEVKLGSSRVGVALELVHPGQDLACPTWPHVLYLCHAAEVFSWTLICIHDENLPVSLALIDEAHSAKGPAPDHLTYLQSLQAHINDVQGVIVTRRLVKLIMLERITEGLWKASVVEGYQLSK